MFVTVILNQSSVSILDATHHMVRVCDRHDHILDTLDGCRFVPHNTYQIVDSYNNVVATIHRVNHTDTICKGWLGDMRRRAYIDSTEYIIDTHYYMYDAKGCIDSIRKDIPIIQFNTDKVCE